MKKFFTEFKKFISRGNVMDMAVGMIIGGAFTAIVTALANGILKPLINTAIYYLIPGDGLESMYTFLVTKYTTVEGSTEQVIDLASSIYIDWGAFISAIINFLLIALVLFLIVKAFNSVKEAEANAKDVVKRAKLKQEKGLKLSRKEKAALEKLAEQEEADRLAKEEAERKALEEANKLTRSEQLLLDIKELLAKK
ncbi:MAG: large conductance mechanosensitive channel protein MscL [Bacillales bacterium]|nr:large conductance mechanosensitive channel protein MscL [Bacillales bacterium]